MSQYRMDQFAQLYKTWAEAQGEERTDAGEGQTFARELLKVRSGVFEERFPNLIMFSLMSRAEGVEPTDEEFTWQTVREYGTTKPGTSYGTDAPSANVAFHEEPPMRIRPLTQSYEFSFHEARVSARLGRQLPQRKANAARRILMTEVDRILAFGGSAATYGVALPGLLTPTLQVAPGDGGVLTYTPPAGISGSALWANKTPDEIVADLRAMDSNVTVNSLGIEAVDTLLIPLAYHETVLDRRMGDGSNETIRSFFLKTAKHIKRIVAMHQLDAAPAGQWTGRRMMSYCSERECVEYLLPVDFEQFAPQIDGFVTKTMAHSRTGGVVIYRPKTFIVADNF